MFDVIIIGGGAVGCSTARELSKYQLKVALLEKENDIAVGQTKANTAIIHGGYDCAVGTQKAKFNISGNKMMYELCKELEVPHKNNTSLVVAFSEDGMSGLEELHQRAEANGCPDTKIIDRDELRRREPNIGSTAYAALLVPTGGIVCPYEWAIANAECAASNGVVFHRNTAVDKISKTEDIFKIETNRGEFYAKSIVNCAGLHSDDINNMLSNEKYTIHPRRGEYYIVDKTYNGTFNASIFQLPTRMGKGILVTPTVDGTLLIGPTAEDINDKLDTSNTMDGLKSVLEGAALTWENIPRRGFITNYTGLRAHSNVGDFILGESSDVKLFFNAGGIESPGLVSSPAIAKFLGDEIAEKLGAKVNHKFIPHRKSLVKFRELSNEERAKMIATNEKYGKVICRCETITEAEIRESIRRPVGALDIDGVKRRTRAGMGRCQGGFCMPRVTEILCEELGISPLEVTKFGGESKILTGNLFENEVES